jgi:hypothetical protein
MLICNYLQLPFYFDANRLQEEVNRLTADLWQLHYQKLHYEGGWSAIPLRSVGGKSDNIIISPLENATYSDTFILNDCPYLQEVLSTFKCPLLAARLLKLDAGAVIKEHRDAELCYEKGEVRIHIPVITNDEVEFYLVGDRMMLKEGECWYMNFNLPHSLHNKSHVDRIHLVIDAKVNGWVKSLFENPGNDPKKETEQETNRHSYVKKDTEDKSGQHDEKTKRSMVALFREMNTPTANNLADELEKELRENMEM